jgi:hypothetical protein
MSAAHGPPMDVEATYTRSHCRHHPIGNHLADAAVIQAAWILSPHKCKPMLNK